MLFRGQLAQSITGGRILPASGRFSNIHLQDLREPLIRLSRSGARILSYKSMATVQGIPEKARTLSRGIDYLGDLGAKLRDLQGDRTLAYELIQNADDAPTATSMGFDVDAYALVVENDGIFSDCGRVEETQCPWKDSRGHRCDFHRIRNIASGDKRAEPNTTGTFGIGFITVYQVTDSPEIISGGRHWKLYEERPEDQRIEVCPGCCECQSANLPGTRLVLPWARASSSLRRKLQLEPVSEQRPARILEQLVQSLSLIHI